MRAYQLFLLTPSPLLAPFRNRRSGAAQLLPLSQPSGEPSMSLSFSNEIAKIASVDLFKKDRKTGEPETGLFIGRPFYLDYDRAYLLVADAWKHKAKGV